jgi:peptidoglycan hydrolase-like protein with peptidoglycan-binding domain
MKKIFSLVAAFSALLFSSALADEETRTAQAELKNQGFYYGETDGELTAETSAAIKRYQIRNGLEVTGTLTKQTLEALGLAPSGKGSSSPAPAARAPATPTPPPREPTHLRRDESLQESDRNYLRRNETAPPHGDDPSVISPPATLDPSAAPGEEYRAIFDRTPYVNAPREVQESTMRRAQTLLAREGYYHEAIDGIPGPATEEAVLTYQRRMRLPLSGRLDLLTLAQMRLLPNRSVGPRTSPFFGGRRIAPERRTYRGIWIE